MQLLLFIFYGFIKIICVSCWRFPFSQQIAMSPVLPVEKTITVQQQCARCKTGEKQSEKAVPATLLAWKHSIGVLRGLRWRFALLCCSFCTRSWQSRWGLRLYFHNDRLFFHQNCPCLKQQDVAVNVKTGSRRHHKQAAWISTDPFWVITTTWR